MTTGFQASATRAGDGLSGVGHDELEVEQHFAMVPEWLLRAAISDRAKTVYAVIQRFGNGSGRRMPGRSEIIEWLHCSPSSVTRAIAELEDFGAIRVTRDTKPAAGELGRVITRNRYLLRTTDPTVAHVVPASGRPPVAYPQAASGLGRPPVRLYRENNPEPPPPTPKPGEEEIDPATLAVLDVDDLIVEARAIRRDQGLPEALWTSRAVRRAIAAAAASGRPADLIGDALRLVAADRDTRQPGRLPHDGPWWHLAEQQQLRRHKQARAAAAREALIEAQARRQAACTRCDVDGMTRNFRGRPIRCDHIPDEEIETA